jgi:hypothetical protein
MDHHDATDNVYALFPGIDTRPFGRANEPPARQPSLADPAWNAEIPTRTLVDDEPPNGTSHADPHPERPGIRRYPPHLRGPIRIAAWVAVALLAGGALALGRSLLITPSDRAPHALASTGHPQPRPTGSRAPTSARRASSHIRAAHKPEQRARAHQRPARPTRAHRPARRPTSASTHTAPTTQSATTTPTTQDSTAGASQPTQPAPATATVASGRTARQPAGPTGLGQQVGGSCDPKCQ